MTQDERRLYLIEELLKEDGGRPGFAIGLVQGEGKSFKIPEDKDSQEKILRSLMNIRDPNPISKEFLEIQDEYLKTLNLERGIIDLAELKPSSIDPQLYLWQGDITTLKVDAIVNAANSALLGCFAPLHACIDNCIHTFSGIQLRLSCNEIMQAQGESEGTGLCKITPAFNLPSKYVLHTVGPIITTTVSKKHQILLSNCYKNCLETASLHGLTSVAFCCISTGVFRFPQSLASKIAVETVRSWLSEHKSPMKVIFNVFSDKDLEYYKELL